MMISEQNLDRLRRIVGPAGFRDQPADLEPYLVEPRRRYRGRSPLLLFPADTAQVAAIVRVCSETGIPIVPQGGNTSMVGGAVPHEDGNEVLVNLARLNRVRAIDAENDTITVEAGCLLHNVREASAGVGRMFPLRLASEGSCQIGGNISTNAGGTTVLRYGNMRNLVLGLEVVLPDGRVWDGLRGLRKDNTGYDLKQLFIGAEGTLGIVTAAVLKLFPRPLEVSTAMVAVPDPDAALRLFAIARALSGDQVTAFELIPCFALELALRHLPAAKPPFTQLPPWTVLIELAGGTGNGRLHEGLEALLEQGVTDGLVTDTAIAASEAQAGNLWRLREVISDAQRSAGASIKCDVSAPVSRLPDLLRLGVAAVEAVCPGIRPCTFGHLGDGSLHFNLTQPEGADPAAFLARWDEISGLVHAVALRLGGSISAEHGIGRMKCREMSEYKPPVEMDLMRAVKQAFDPLDLMNPGKVVCR